MDCDGHYDSSGVPTSAEAQALEAGGYFMLACRPFVTQIYDVMMPYKNLSMLFQLLLWVGLFFYFITSSDSGSFVDDTLGSSGMTNPPVVQKVYCASPPAEPPLRPLAKSLATTTAATRRTR